MNNSSYTPSYLHSSKVSLSNNNSKKFSRTSNNGPVKLIEPHLNNFNLITNPNRSIISNNSRFHQFEMKEGDDSYIISSKNFEGISNKDQYKKDFRKIFNRNLNSNNTNFTNDDSKSFNFHTNFVEENSINISIYEKKREKPRTKTTREINGLNYQDLVDIINRRKLLAEKMKLEKEKNDEMNNNLIQDFIEKNDDGVQTSLDYKDEEEDVPQEYPFKQLQRNKSESHAIIKNNNNNEVIGELFSSLSSINISSNFKNNTFNNKKNNDLKFYIINNNDNIDKLNEREEKIINQNENKIGFEIINHNENNLNKLNDNNKNILSQLEINKNENEVNIKKNNDSNNMEYNIISNNNKNDLKTLNEKNNNENKKNILNNNNNNELNIETNLNSKKDKNNNLINSSEFDIVNIENEESKLNNISIFKINENTELNDLDFNIENNLDIEKEIINKNPNPSFISVITNEDFKIESNKNSIINTEEEKSSIIESIINPKSLSSFNQKNEETQIEEYDQDKYKLQNETKEINLSAYSINKNIDSKKINYFEETLEKFPKKENKDIIHYEILNNNNTPSIIKLESFQNKRYEDFQPKISNVNDNNNMMMKINNSAISNKIMSKINIPLRKNSDISLNKSNFKITDRENTLESDFRKSDSKIKNKKKKQRRIDSYSDYYKKKVEMLTKEEPKYINSNNSHEDNYFKNNNKEYNNYNKQGHLNSGLNSNINYDFFLKDNKSTYY